MNEQDESARFSYALALVEQEFYLDGIQEFVSFAEDFPASELADDALYNAARARFELNQFVEATTLLEDMIQRYPDGSIATIGAADEHGSSCAKAKFLLVQCSLGLGDLERAEAHANALREYSDSYVVVGTQRRTYEELANDAIRSFRVLTDD